ncbi:MAG: hypothetical protein AAGB93_07760 [Planctomycetota bacterium]
MSLLLVSRSVLASLARRPLWWLVASVLLASWPALRTFLPLGLATADLHHWTGAYELALFGGIVAILGGMGPLGRMGWILERAGPVRRTALETAALVLCAAALAAFVLVPAHLLDVWQFARFRVGDSLLALVLAWLHVAVVAACALRLPVEPTVRVAVVLLATCVVPPLLAGGTFMGEALLAILDAGASLRASFDFRLGRAHWIAASLPIVGWGAVAVALASPAPTLPVQPHAVRDPR